MILKIVSEIDIRSKVILIINNNYFYVFFKHYLVNITGIVHLCITAPVLAFRFITFKYC